jgi:hypothetical protein
MSTTFRTTCVFLLALALAAPGALAQTAQVGNIAGQVVDESGAVLPGAIVTARSQERGFARTVTTDAAGRFLFPVIPLGSYEVTATLDGFEVLTLTDNLVEAERTTALTMVLRLGSISEQITVSGETPIVDMTNTSVNTRVRAEEFERLAVGRNYQTLIGMAPGVVGTGNVNAHGALTSNNQFLFDGVNTTDPTTGTFGSNLNFEAIQEVSIYTAGISAEYGRAVGAVVNVITKSGTNRFEGSGKYLFANDEWNAQNKTRSETTGASLERTKFDQLNPVYSFTVGGPIWRDRAWFFNAFEYAETLRPQRQTAGQIPEDYQDKLESPFWNLRLTAQLSPTQNIWGKYHTSPTNGFAVEYHTAGERFALTTQDQGASSVAVQWSGVFGANMTAEAMFADNQEFIDVYPYEVSTLLSGAPIFNLAENRYYNGGAFDGTVDRPRRQTTAAVTYYANLGGNSHSFKAGFDWQGMKSTAQFDFPNSQLYIVNTFNQATREMSPSSRRDYDSGASTSKGNSYALYFRDKFEVGRRLFFEAGVRFERQTGTSDVGAATVDTTTLAPRLSGSYDLAGTGKQLVVGTYGRFYQGILQGFSDSYANIPQKTNYNNFVWDGTQYVFSNRVQVGAANFETNTGLKPTYADEATIGFQQQVGRTVGATVRYVWRSWNNMIDDIRVFGPGNATVRSVTNYALAERSYNGVELMLEKRYSNNWNAAANYTYSRTRGNQFADTFTSLGDYVDASCRVTGDVDIPIVSCREVTEGANLLGRPTYDRPHNLKMSGAYTRPVGRVFLTAGLVGHAISKTTYERVRTAHVLLPGTTTNAGPTYTYFYEPRGSERLPGLAFTTDLAIDASFRLAGNTQAGFKAEIFNLTDSQEKIGVGSTVWCTSDSSAACATARDNFGKATARGHFQGPRTYRFSAIFRF